MEDKISLQLSKKKMLSMSIGAFAFVLLGIWFIINPPIQEKGLFSNAKVIQVLGIISVLFFGLLLFTFFRKILDKQPGLIIDEHGITDNASAVSAGHIPWSEIQQLKTIKESGQYFLMIIVDDPYKYIERQKSPLKRKISDLNFKRYGSPINISANTLECDFERLKKIVQDKFDKQNLIN
jgi:hypothetical protein